MTEKNKQSLLNPFLQNVQYEILQLKDMNAAIDCLTTAFTFRESLALALKATKEEVRLYTELLCEKAIKESLSIVAKNKITGELLGCVISRDLASKAIHNEAIDQNPKFQIATQFISTLMRPLYEKEGIIQKNNYLHSIIAGVRKEFLNNGIFKQMFFFGCKTAYNKGFKFLCGEYTSSYTYKVISACDGGFGEDLTRIKLKDFVYQGKVLFPDSTYETIFRVTPLNKINGVRDQ